MKSDRNSARLRVYYPVERNVHRILTNRNYELPAQGQHKQRGVRQATSVRSLAAALTSTMDMLVRTGKRVSKAPLFHLCRVWLEEYE